MALGYKGMPQAERPSGMEAMVAKLLGFTPEQMQETLTSFRDTIVTVGATLARVEANQVAILARIEAMENGGQRDSYSDGAAIFTDGRTIVGNAAS